MSAISTYCHRCQRSLEVPAEFDNVVCPGCGTAYWIRRHADLISLSEVWPDPEDSRRGENALAVIESRLAEIDELIEEAESESESLRSREQSAPLQKGCAFFGLFTTVIVVIAVFMLVGKGYVGSWVFYVSVAAVVFLSLVRIRSKLVGSVQLNELRQDRKDIDEGLGHLQAERVRILELRSNLSSRKSTE
jgi:predicted RNA-binding Zn-ribbon protein involved in translation (DUF1610 family)